MAVDIWHSSPSSPVPADSVSNDYLDYAPPPEQFPKGGYEVETTIFKPDSGRIITDAANDLLRKLHARAAAR